MSVCERRGLRATNSSTPELAGRDRGLAGEFGEQLVRTQEGAPKLVAHQPVERSEIEGRELGHANRSLGERRRGVDA
jgi:hypothetical protein